MDHSTPKSWLWLASLVIAVIAAVLVYFIKDDQGFMNADETTNAIIMVAVIAIGICIISATSGWWTHR